MDRRLNLQQHCGYAIPLETGMYMRYGKVHPCTSCTDVSLHIQTLLTCMAVGVHAHSTDSFTIYAIIPKLVGNNAIFELSGNDNPQSKAAEVSSYTHTDAYTYTYAYMF